MDERTSSATVTHQPLDADGQPAGNPVVYAAAVTVEASQVTLTRAD